MSDTVLSGLNSGFDRMVVFSGGCGGESFPSFPAFKVAQNSFTPPSSQLVKVSPVKSHIVSLWPWFCLPTSFLTLTLCSIFKGPHVTQTIQDNLPIRNLYSHLHFSLPYAWIYIYLHVPWRDVESWSIHAYLSSFIFL